MKDKGITIFRFNNLAGFDGLWHGVFSRYGGQSAPPFDSLNVGLNTGDKYDFVQENRKRIALELDMKPAVYLRQVHEDTIKVLKKNDNDLASEFEPGRDIYTADGLVTDIQGIFLVIQVADCQPVMLYDPEKKVVANVHSGWRSSIRNILGRCIETMVDGFGCDPGDIRAGIGPSLGPCCAEFINYETEIPRSLWSYRVKDTCFFDFWRMSRDQLVEKGVEASNVESMNICTRCSTDNFFSYRHSRKTGRFACIIGMPGTRTDTGI